MIFYRDYCSASYVNVAENHFLFIKLLEHWMAKVDALCLPVVGVPEHLQ